MKWPFSIEWVVNLNSKLGLWFPMLIIGQSQVCAFSFPEAPTNVKQLQYAASFFLSFLCLSFFSSSILNSLLCFWYLVQSQKRVPLCCFCSVPPLSCFSQNCNFATKINEFALWVIQFPAECPNLCCYVTSFLKCVPSVTSGYLQPSMQIAIFFPNYYDISHIYKAKVRS